jgi:lysophospholipase L1-like esterase
VRGEETQVTATTSSGLDVPDEFTAFAYPLPACARIVANGGPLTIVALGASSTAGAYASSPAASYPARLEAELARLFPDAAISVLNRGTNGEDVAENLARFDASVAAERPHLVLWQVGTNWLMQERPLDEFNRLLVEGLGRIRSIGAEAVLIDTQYAPALCAKADFPSFVTLMANIGRQYRTNVFRRLSIMQHWHTVLGMPLGQFLAPDELHMNDWSYERMARLLAKALAAVLAPHSRT